MQSTDDSGKLALDADHGIDRRPKSAICGRTFIPFRQLVILKNGGLDRLYYNGSRGDIGYKNIP